MTSAIFGRQGVFSRSSGIASVKLPPGYSAARLVIKTEKYSNLHRVFIHGRVAGNVVEILLVEKLFAIDAAHEETTEHLEILVQSAGQFRLRHISIPRSCFPF